jgi:transposase
LHKLPADVRKLLNDALLARNDELQQQVELLTARCEALSTQVEELKREKNKNSSNSGKPPSSDNLGERRSIRKPKKPTGKKRGGQPGHKGHYRERLPSEQVDQIINLFPDYCDVCQQEPPRIPQLRPWRHQVVELLENGGGRHVDEYRCHEVTCTCGAVVAAPVEKVPSSAFGPRLSSAVCALTGNFQVSRRQVVVLLKELFGITMSLGSVSNIEGRMNEALAEPSDAAMLSADAAAIKNVDETSWIRDFERCSAWVFATALVSVFRIVADGSRKNLRKVLKRRRGILISDRAAVFLYWKMKRRQICWSHLLRLFIDFSQRDGPAAQFGRELVDSAELVFIYWRKFQAKRINRAELVRLVSVVRDGMKPCLERARQADIAHVSGSCANLLEHWEAMWTFLEHPGVEPTNNHGERELRRLVLWRKRCFGSQSERGDRFVERMLTVTHTLRKQKRDVLDFLHQCFVAKLSHTQVPDLLATA